MRASARTVVSSTDRIRLRYFASCRLRPRGKVVAADAGSATGVDRKFDLTVKCSMSNRPAPAPLHPTDSSWISKLGPGLITGAADDDPSGIATYSQAGAQFGYS